MSTKPGSMPVLVLPIPTDVQNISKLAFLPFLQHPGETFDVAPFVDGRCKTPIEEIQTAADGAISMEQAVKLRQCLNHIDELEKHQAEIEREIFCLSDKYESILNLI